MSLPDDCYINIFIFLETKELIVIKKVCSLFYKIIDRPSFAFYKLKCYTKIKPFQFCHYVEKLNLMNTVRDYFKKDVEFGNFLITSHGDKYKHLRITNKKIRFRIGGFGKPLKYKDLYQFGDSCYEIILHHIPSLSVFSQIISSTIKYEIKSNIERKIKEIKQIERDYSEVYWNSKIDNPKYYYKSFDIDTLKSKLKKIPEINHKEIIMFPGNYTKFYSFTDGILKKIEVTNIINFCNFKKFILEVELSPLYFANGQWNIHFICKKMIILKQKWEKYSNYGISNTVNFMVLKRILF